MAVVVDPNIWRSLPEDLQELVIAHLPLTEIFQLQLLSKKWRDRTVTGKESVAFRKACAENNPKMFAIVSEDDHERGTFHIRAHDTKMNKWHTYDMRTTSMDPPIDRDFHHLTASDGGLVCCVSRVYSHQPLVIIVCNPLTREMKTLPAPKVLSNVQPHMVQLVMDRSTKYYEVIVAGWKDQAGTSRAGDSHGGFIAEIYNSETGAWSDINNSVSDYVFGYQYSQNPVTLSWSLVPMLLDYQERQLLQLNSNPWQGLPRVKKIDLVKDHLFTLQMQTGTANRQTFAGLKLYCCGTPDVTVDRRKCRCTVTERRGQKGDPNWVRVKEHVIPIEIWNTEWGGSVRFYACTGFLLIISIHGDQDEDQDITQLYDLSTGRCTTIPALPRRVAYEDHFFEHVILSRVHHTKEIMCELQWDAIP